MIADLNGNTLNDFSNLDFDRGHPYFTIVLRSWSPNGNYLAVEKQGVKDNNGTMVWSTLVIDISAAKIIQRLDYAGCAQFGKDSFKLIYTMDPGQNGDIPTASYYVLQSVNVGGSDIKTLASDTNDCAFYSPDYSKILYQDYQSGSLYTVKSNGSDKSLLKKGDVDYMQHFRINNSYSLKSPWSPDGKSIALSMYDSSRTLSRLRLRQQEGTHWYANIYVLNVASGALTKITQNNATKRYGYYNIGWTPYGRLYYVLDTDLDSFEYSKGSGIYTVRPNGTEKKFITPADEEGRLDWVLKQ